MAEKDWINRYFAPLSTEGARNLGDDVAAMSDQQGWRIITTDALVEGVHFLSEQSVRSLARKLVRVNVSDILAKGAKPGQATLTLGWPAQRSEDELAEFAAGFAEELQRWGIGLLGGDTVSSPVLFVSLTLTGEPFADERSPIWMDGARVGDDILLTGKIGGIIGLDDAKFGKATPAAHHYYEPEIPSIEAAQMLSTYAHAATDVSDGLLGDLSQLLERARVGGEFDLGAVRYWHPSDETSVLIDQCTCGDDYQIVCTAAPADSEKLVLSGHFYKIGRITREPGLRLSHKGRAVNLPETMGFEHGR